MLHMMGLVRWTDRKGCIVQWGNVVGGSYRGDEFEEEFDTEAEAKERERQVKAGEGIGADREPVAIRRVRLH